MGPCLGKNCRGATATSPWPERDPTCRGVGGPSPRPPEQDSTCCGAVSVDPSLWPDLLPELVGNILSRLPSVDDRLSFRAVCRRWRLAAPLLPPAPWINFGHGVYQSLADGDGGRFATPAHCLPGNSFGSWLLHEQEPEPEEHDDREPSSRCFLTRDPFPGDLGIEVPCQYYYQPRAGRTVVVGNCDTIRLHHLGGGHGAVVHKIVVCSPHLIVALFHGPAFDAAPVNVACFRPGQRQPPPRPLSWSAPATASKPGDYHRHHYRDIAFHRGKLFALCFSEQLVAHTLVDAQGHALSRNRSHVEHAITQGPQRNSRLEVEQERNHLVASSDKRNLFMVRWGIPCCEIEGHGRRRALDLQVFEADLDWGQWTEVKKEDIKGQDLYVSRAGSRAFAAEAGSSDEHHHGRVFVLGKESASAVAGFCKCYHCEKLVKNDNIPSYCVYDMMNGEISQVSLNGGDHGDTPAKSCSGSEWFFPSYVEV